MKIVLSHPIGNQNVRNALLALYQEDSLLRFYTAVGWSQDNLLTKLAPPGLGKKLSRLSYAIPAKLMRNSPVLEFLRLARPFGSSRAVTIDDVLMDLDRRVAADLPGLKSRHGATGVFAYEDGALSTLQAARQLGLDGIYELHIGYWRAGHQIFNEEKERQPEWE